MQKRKCILVGLAFIAMPALARTVFLSDFDSTLVEDRAEFKGTFVTPVRLFRTPNRVTTLQNEIEGPEFIDISSQDYYRIENYLARDAQTPGSLGMEFRLSDGRTVTPGLYFIRRPESYTYFSSNPPGGGSSLLTSLNQAKRGHWKGMAFPLMQAFLSSPETAKNFGILTARMHSSEEWMAFFAQLKADGEIQHLPANTKLLYSIALPKFDIFSLNPNIIPRKTAIFREVFLSLARVPLNPDQQILNADGSGLSNHHVLVYAEDNQEVLDALVIQAQAFARDGRFPIKIVFLNAGYGTEVKASRRPQKFVVRSDGTFRPLQDFAKEGLPSLPCAVELVGG